MPMPTTSTPNLSEQLRAIVGRDHVLTDEVDLAPFLTDWRGRYRGAAQSVVRPADTAEVSAVVQLCAAAGVPMLPQGGNTSLCGAATPDGSGRAVVISLGRLNRLRQVDPVNNTLTVEAGCTLATVQAAAEEAGRLFPLSLAAQGSCQIGGNLSTNAGGVQVLRYGNTRELTLGLEVVLPNGEILNSLRGLRKDNTGYDLKQLFIGAEGTLGVITAAVLKLFPLPSQHLTAWLALPTPQAALTVLAAAQRRFEAQLTAFELVSETSLALVLQHIPGALRPLPQSPWYVLCEFSAGAPDALSPLAVENWLAEHIGRSVVSDAVLAQSASQAARLWQLRENISEAQKIDGVSIKHDISVPVSCIPVFLERADQLLRVSFPGIRTVAFGHVGDGNLHYNLSRPQAQDHAGLIAEEAAVNRLIYDLVHDLGGSISAEHGIGQLKRDELGRYKSPVELGLMRAIKQAIDPRGLMNPGKIL